MKFTLEIDCDTAAFDGEPGVEIGRILGRLGERVASFGPRMGAVLDVNGNTVGAFALTEGRSDGG